MRSLQPVFLLLFLLLSYCLDAQTTLSFTLPSYSPLSVSAGNDTLARPGDKLSIGGTPAAAGGSGSYSYSWTPATGLDNPAVAHPAVRVDSAITYMLSVTDLVTGCHQSSSVHISVGSGMNLRVYPNPSNGSFVIRTDSIISDPALVIQIYDIMGKQIYFERMASNGRLNRTIHITGHTGGLYILKISGLYLLLTERIIIK